jgi:D-serine dehydratase
LDDVMTVAEARRQEPAGMDLAGLLDSMIEPTTKGWPTDAGPLPLAAIGRQNWRLLEQALPLPVVVLKDSVLASNSRWMRAFLDQYGVALAPHGKTTMAPQLYARQLADGAFAITVATVQQLLVCRRFGVPRVLLANQLTGPQAIATVARELGQDPTFEFYCLADSVAGVEQLVAGLRASGLRRPLQVLLEVGFAGGRTGCRQLEEALAVARAVAAAPELALVGIEGYEGLIRRDSSAATEARIWEFLAFMRQVAVHCAEAGLFAPGPVLLSAGGTSHFDQVARALRRIDLGRAVQIVLRSGCYLTHDSKMYAQSFAELMQRTPEAQSLAGPGLRPALEIWAYVQSVPEPGRAIVTMGKRDVSHDVDLPIPEHWFRPKLHQAPQPLGSSYRVVALNDQHAYMKLPRDHPLQVGDMVGFGISHPCTTFDKWQLLYVVDDDYRVIEGIRTFF